MTATLSGRQPRKDAARNRALLVDAAARAFREHGLAASVNAIARDAGVNVATLYRHFPTKDHLIVAVLDEVLEPLRVARDRALAVQDDAEVLATFVRDAVGRRSRQQRFVDTLANNPSGPEVGKQLRRRAIEIVTPVVERAKRSGELGPDYDALDVLIALNMLAHVARAPSPAGQRTARCIEVVLRGLRAG